MSRMSIKKTALALSIVTLMVGSQMPVAFAGFEVVQNGVTPKPSPPLQVISEAQDNARLRAELDRLTAELASVKVQLDNSRADATNAKQALARANAKLDLIQNKLEKLTVTFAFGKIEFAPQPEIIGKLIDSANQAQQVDVRGFTDSLGTLAENQRMAMNRALAAKKYLTMKGVSETKIKVYGLTGQYVATNATEVGRAANRRVEIEFVK